MAKEAGNGAKPEETAPVEPPVAGTPPLPTGPPTVLNGTSQGRINDIPPNDWIDEEIIRYGVVGTSGIQPPNLSRSPHPIFDRKRFPDMDDKRFKAMEQSILLASTFLEIGYPFLAAFLPDPNYAPGFNPRGNDHDRPYDRVDLLQRQPRTEGVRIVKEELDEICEIVQWREDPDLFDRAWWGLTVSVYPRATKNFAHIPIQITKEMDNKLQRDGHSRRQTTIAFVTYYVDTLLSSERTTEQHFCAAFHLAVTLVHEIGHLVYWQNVSNKSDILGWEPVVGNQVDREIGFAFTAWIFGGWNPMPIIEYEDGHKKYFNKGMLWSKQLEYQFRPRWTMRYSMPFKYIQTLLTQSTWDPWEGNFYHPDVKAIVEVRTPFRYGHNARIAICEKREVRKGNWVWKKAHNPLRLFNLNEDDDEDFGNQPEGYPPFGFIDQDWTTDLEKPTQQDVPTSRVARLEVPGRMTFARQVAPDEEETVRIQITYSGVYDATTGKVTPPPEHSIKQKQKQISGTIDYTDWPEGVLRNQCVERGLSASGDRGELIDRLKATDAAAGTKRSTATIKSTTQSPRERSDDPTKLIYTLTWQTTLEDLQLLVWGDTGIPPELQLLWLNADAGLEQPQNLEDPVVLAHWRQILGWNDVDLLRLKHAPEPDPGPLPPGPARPSIYAVEESEEEKREEEEEEQEEEEKEEREHTSVRRHLRKMLRPRKLDVVHPWSSMFDDWDDMRKQYCETIQNLQAVHAALCAGVADRDAEAGDREYRTYIEVLTMLNKALEERLKGMGVQVRRRGQTEE